MPHFAVPPFKRLCLTVLSLTKISLRRGRKVLIKSASLQVHAGQRMGVIGGNGSGK